MMNEAPVVLRETEIRPDELMDEQVKRYARDVARLVANREKFVTVGCPACEARESEVAFEKFSLNYNLCGSCQTLYISPRPTPELLEEYYRTSENYEYWNKFIFPASEEARRAKIFTPRVDRVLEICRRYDLPGETLLEVGAGFGTFCEELARRAFFKRIIAIEPTPSLAQTCRNKGVEVIEKRVEDVAAASDLNVDLVVSFEVLEHLFSPRDFLLRCFELIKPQGLLILTCPNGKGFDVMTLGPLSDTVDTEHLNYFNPASISSLLQSCGFEVLEATTPGKLDAELVRKKVMSGAVSLDKQPFLREILVENWATLGQQFQDFLVSSQMSSHMWIVARRPE